MDKENRQQGQAKTVPGSRLVGFVPGLLLVILSANYLSLFMTFSNAEEVSLPEVLPLLGVFSTIAVGLFLCVLLFTKKIWISAFAAMVAALLTTNFTFVERVFSLFPVHLRYWHVVALVMFLFLHFTYFIARFISEEQIKTVSQVLLLVFAGLLTFNLFTALPTIVGRVSVSTHSSERTETPSVSLSNEDKLPNIYYFIFDEFSAQSTIEKYYDYSNTEFFQALEDLGFTVSYDSKNMSYATVTVTANYMNYDYVVGDQDSTQIRLEARQNNATKTLMQAYGYSFSFLGAGNSNGDWGIADNQIGSSNSSGATTVGGKTILDLILERSIVYPVVDIEGSSADLASRINEVFSFFETPNNYCTSKSTYTLIYLESPHEPFIFNADGSLNNPKYYYEWENSQYYLHQYQYISTKIIETAKNIVANDPDAVIIFQSDHSARWASFIAAADKTAILNAVYYRGEPIDEIQGKSGVNTLRTVYGKLFGLDLPDVEVAE